MNADPTDARTRMEALEDRLGDPWDPAGPAGFAAIVAADEREDTPEGGKAALDDFGILSEFVPADLGGRLVRVDDLVELMRSVYRRDPGLGLGHCSSSLLGAVNVWTAGSAGQRRYAADLLLAGDKISCAFHELAHGNDIGSVDFAATAAGNKLLLNGRKESITNLDRADAVVFLARTDPRGGPRANSQLFLPVSDLEAGRTEFLPRFRSVGMRGVRLGGIEVNACEVEASSLLGAPGTGMETVARAFQLTRMALPAMSTSVLDTTLRVTLHHVLARRLYGRRVADIPLVRTTLANAFADMLLCEAFAAAACRSLHVLPELGSVYAPAVKYFLSGVLVDAIEQLSLVMGAEFYRRDGQHAVFQKMTRDMKPVAFGHIARAACLSAMLPQLPVLARRAWQDAEPAPRDMYAADGKLPSLDLAGLRLTAGRRDGLVGTLGAALDSELPSAVRPLVETQVERMAATAEACARLRPRDLSIAAPVEVRDLAAGYTSVLAAASCVGAWQHAEPDEFLSRPAWLTAALTRLGGHALGRPVDVPLELEGELVEELLSRYDRSVSFGMSARRYR
ncbi:acyl-CoA dehydrogenase [Streptomyces sp. NPDC091406]|uniref:acyl-CoA dehydrogenase n=1 Tax=unclassified Streptomyces TaxID=2593676 RepID=UPI0037F844E1